jgi:hypothetical protein
MNMAVDDHGRMLKPSGSGCKGNLGKKTSGSDLLSGTLQRKTKILALPASYLHESVLSSLPLQILSLPSRFASGGEGMTTAWSILARRLIPAFLLAACVLLLASCSSTNQKKLYAVRGKILYNGQPAEGAEVIFQPKGQTGVDVVLPTGVALEDGSFTLKSYLDKNGAPAGSYDVLIKWPEDSAPDPVTKKKVKGKPKQRMKSLPEDYFKGRYADPKSPKFHADITEGSNELPPFELKD